MITCTLLSDRGVKYCSCLFEGAPEAKRWALKSINDKPHDTAHIIENGVVIETVKPITFIR